MHNAARTNREPPPTAQTRVAICSCVLTTAIVTIIIVQALLIISLGFGFALNWLLKRTTVTVQEDLLLLHPRAFSGTEGSLVVLRRGSVLARIAAVRATTVRSPCTAFRRLLVGSREVRSLLFSNAQQVCFRAVGRSASPGSPVRVALVTGLLVRVRRSPVEHILTSKGTANRC